MNPSVCAQPSASETELTAFHEAGHAAVGVVYQLPIARVTIDPERVGAATGYCIVGRASVPREEADRIYRERPDALPTTLPDSFAATLLHLLAGGAAEVHRVGRPTGDGDWRDRLEAEHLIGLALGVPPWSREVRAVMGAARAFASYVVWRHRHSIERIAAALLERGTLDGDEIRELL